MGDPGRRRRVAVPAAGVARLVVDEDDRRGRVVDDAEPDDATLRLLHRTIDGVRADYAALRFNTAIAKLIELTNHLTKAGAGGAARAWPSRWC